MIELFKAVNWQMTVGERAALAGLLAELKPGVAIEIGSAEGGSLECIAAHAREVHTFDLDPPSSEAAELGSVTPHTGDSHKLLPQVLREFEQRGVNVDFVLVDGDHSAGGVRRDVEDLLGSSSITSTLIVLHDTANEEVRRGLETVPYHSYPKVRAVDLDCVPGYLVKAPLFHHELWGGLGLILVDERATAEHGMHLVSNIAYPATTVLAGYRDRVLHTKARSGRPRSRLRRAAGTVRQLRSRAR